MYVVYYMYICMDKPGRTRVYVCIYVTKGTNGLFHGYFLRENDAYTRVLTLLVVPRLSSINYKVDHVWL